MKEPDTLGFLLVDTARLLRAEFEKRIASAGLDLTPGEARTLLNVGAREGGRQNAIAEKMGIEPMTLSGYLDRLETLKLVERVPDPADRRAKNVVLTDKADATLKAIRRQSDIMIDELQTGLDADERAALRQAMRVIKANFSKIASGQLET